MKRALKIRIYPTDDQAAFLAGQFGAVRFVYNRALAIKSHRYKRHGENLSAKHDLKKLIARAKKSDRYSWLKLYDSMALQQACINLDRAFSNFFRKKLKARYPRFKSRRSKQSSYHCTGVSCGGSWINVPKMSPIKARIHREMNGVLTSITLSKTCTGKYFASLLYEDMLAAPALPVAIDESAVTGMDMGITHIVIESNGDKVENPRFLKKAQNNLRRKQKSLSLKKKGSKNRNKARLLVAKAHERVANRRNDFQHKLSKRLVDENQALVFETLKVKNMLGNRCLSKAISDAAWSELLRQVEYKAERAACHVVRISQWFPSSKTCSCCDYVMDSLPLGIRRWSCPSCGVTHDRDINAALNIKNQGITKLKAEGLSVSACGGLRKTTQWVAAA